MSEDGMPWFPFWVTDFITSRRVRLMTPEQVGVYVLLLCQQWMETPLPDDVDALARLVNDADSNTVRTVLDQCFSSVPGGWVNERLEDVRAEQEEKRMKKVRAGRASGRARRKKGGGNDIEHRSNAA